MKRLFQSLTVLFCILLSSCTGIRYGYSTKVTIESVDGGKDAVKLTAYGKKKVNEYEVTLPYKMKVHHKNLPIRVSIESPYNQYQPFTINKMETNWGDVEKKGWNGTGYTFLICSAVELGIGAAICAGVHESIPKELFLVSGITAAASLPMFGFGALSTKYIPEKKQYFIDPIPLTTKEYTLQSSDSWKKLNNILDIYRLNKNGEFEIAKYKATHLLNEDETGELYYLKGIAEYELGEYKKSIKDLSKAKEFSDVTKDMRAEINEYLQSAREQRSIQLQERQNRWASIVNAALQVASATFQYGYMQNNNFTGFQRDKSMDFLLDPRYAIMQVQQQNYNEYLQMTNGGQTMTYDEWFQNVKGPALAEEYQNEHGLSDADNNDNETGYKGVLTPEQYETQYHRWEKVVEGYFNNLTTGGYKVQDNNGNISGKADNEMKGWAYVGNKSGLKRAQNEMRKIRLEAVKYGVQILQSKWETATANY